MKRGLVIGKFLPLHAGHVALIRFAAAQCDELIVSMSFTQHDPIEPVRRFAWIKEAFHDNPAILPAMVPDDFDNETLPLAERTRVWSDFIRKTYPPVHVVFSSEDYGVPFALHLGVQHIAFEPGRSTFPVSGTAIRHHAMRYWDLISHPARQYFVKRLCIYGPESTGKSTLTRRLAAHYHTAFVPEVARELITSNDFSVDDIVRIGFAHHERVMAENDKAHKILFCDTDVITTQIYSQLYLGVVPPVLHALERCISYHHYFFLDIDVPWVPDGLRDLGDRRQEMRAWFLQELERRNISYTILRGSFEEREQTIRAFVDALLV